MIKKKIKEVLHYFLALDETLSLEHRLFLSAVIIGILLSLLSSIVSIIISSSIIVSIITLILFFSLVILYYLVRVKKIFKPFVTPLIVVSFIAIAIIWITDGGINGSDLFVGFVILVLGLIIVPVKNKKYIFTLFITLVIIIYLIQFYRPDLISDFPSETTRWIDSLITAIYSSFFLLLIIRFLHKNYADEKHRAEESEKKILSITENSADAIFITDQQGKYIYTNKAVSAMLGYSLEEMRNKTIADLSPPDKTEKYFKDFKRILTEGRLFTELELLKKDGNYISTDLNAILLPEGSVYGSCRDITERKQANLKLKEREKEFRSLAESMPQIVWTTRADGWNTYFNQQWVDYTGLTLEESYGHGWNTPFHPEDKQRAWDAWQNAVNNNAEYSIECRLRCHDGTYHWWLVRGVPQINADGEIIKWFGTCTDIEKIKEAELALKEDEKQLLKLNADKNRFISILSHDLINPFNNLLGLSEALREDIRKINIDEIEIYANNINSTARNTFNLLESLLIWGRAQQDKIPFNPQVLRFRDICLNILDTLNPIADGKGIKIIYSAPSGTDVFADADMLKTVLRNLVSNAIKFTNRNGTININKEENSEYVTISVSDNGIGITPDNLSKLFDISQVLTTKGTAEETGTGLGLFICKEFIEKHGGKIWVESEVGKGSDFRFTLPASS